MWQMEKLQAEGRPESSLSLRIVASPQHRLGGFFLEFGLIVLSSLTFGLAWIIWSFILWGHGQTPSKQILKMRVYSIDTGKPATWGHMAIRQVLIPMTFSMISLPFFIAGISLAVEEASDLSIGGVIIVGYIAYFVVLLLDYLWIFKNSNNRRLTDMWAKTTVINEI